MPHNETCEVLCMDFFASHKKDRNMFLHIIIALVFLLNIETFTGNLIEVDGFTMYSNDYGEVVKDSWVWIDTNRDSIAECYRFDKEGHIAINYKDRYGKVTNENGQFVENNEVVRKMLSNGEILNKKETPAYGILEFIGNIINPKPKSGKDKWTGKVEEINVYETNGIDETIDGKVLYAKYDDDEEIDILNGAVAESGVIYSSGKASNISDGVKVDREIVAGKEFRKFITSKNKCDEKVTETYIYGGGRWEDALVLNGNGASVKFKLDKENFIRFEVAHQTHGEETRDTDITLDMFVDGKLIDSFDEFVDSEPQVVEEYLEDAKTVELKVNIKSGSFGRKVYIRNGRFRKVKIKD